MEKQPRIKHRKITLDRDVEPLAKKLREAELPKKLIVTADGAAREVKAEDVKPVQVKPTLVTGFEGPIKDKLEDETVLAEVWLNSGFADQQVSSCLGSLTKILEEIYAKKTTVSSRKVAIKGTNPEEDWKKTVMRQIFTQVANLRTMNRYQKLALKKYRDQAQNARLVVDNFHYQYQNLVAEANYVRREVRACQKFRSLDEDMKLIPVEHFLRVAPGSLTLQSVKEDPHKLQLARLKYELSTRQELNEQCKQARSKRSKCTDEIKRLQRRLNGFLPAAERILVTCGELEEVFPKSRTIMAQIHMEKRSKYLPAALTAIYAKMLTYQETSDEKVSVAITGSFTEAEALRERNPWEDLAIVQPEPAEEEPTSDVEIVPDSVVASFTEDYDAVGGSSSSSDEAEDFEDTREETKEEVEKADTDSDEEVARLNALRTMRRAKRSKKDKRKKKKASKKKRQEAIKEQRRQACKPHPVSLLVTVLVGRGSAVTMEFLYFPFFNFVTVKATVEAKDWEGVSYQNALKVLLSRNVLDELVETLGVPYITDEDSDYPSPNPTTIYRAKRLKISKSSYRAKFNEKDMGVPYWWAQAWADLPFTPLQPKETRKKVLAKIPGHPVVLEVVEREEELEDDGIFERMEGGDVLEKLEMKPHAERKLMKKMEEKGSVEEIVKCLRLRVNARVSMAKQVDILDEIAVKNQSNGPKIPIPVDPSVRHLFPSQDTIAALTVWKLATEEEARNFMYFGELNDDRNDNTGLEEIHGDSVHLRYLAMFVRGDAKFMVLVLMAPSFPKTPPKFFLVLDFLRKFNSRNDNRIREIEREVNTNNKELLKQKEKLLPHLMQRAATLFDVFMETIIGGDRFPRHFRYSLAHKSRFGQLACKFVPSVDAFCVN